MRSITDPKDGTTEYPVLGAALVSRRRFLQAGLAVGGFAAGGPLLAACGSSKRSTTASTPAPPTSLTKVSFQLGWLKTVQWAGSYIADTKGYFTQNGIQPEFIAGGPTVLIEPAVIAGKALIGNSTADKTAAAINQGGSLKIVASAYQKAAFDIISLATKPLMTPKDMEGKKIGVQGGNLQSFTAFMKLNSVDASKVTIVPVQFDPTPLKTGDVDGYLGIYTNEPGALHLQGTETHSMLWDDFGFKLFFDSYCVPTQALADTQQRQTLVKFFRAEIKGWQDCLADETTSVDLTVNNYGKDLKLDPNLEQYEWTAQKSLVSTPYTQQNGLFKLPPDLITQNIQTLAASGISITADKLFDTTLLDEVYAGKTTI